MAQKQFHRYQDDVKSFELGEALVGIIRPGRLSGYNTIAVVDNVDPAYIDLTLSHNSGLKKSSNNTTPELSDDLGVVVTRQGQVIQDTSDVSIPAIPKLDQGDLRVDIIYLDHIYEESLSPTPITYGIQLGDPQAMVGSSSLPPFTVPELLQSNRRVIIGYLVWGIATNIPLGIDVHWVPINSADNIGDSFSIRGLVADNVADYIWNYIRSRYNGDKNPIGFYRPTDDPPIISKNRSIIHNLKALANTLNTFMVSSSNSDTTDWVDLKPYFSFGDIFYDDTTFFNNILKIRRSGGNIHIHFRGRPKDMFGGYASNLIQPNPSQEGIVIDIMTDLGIHEQMGSSYTHMTRVPTILSSNSTVATGPSNFDGPPIYAIFNKLIRHQDDYSLDFRTPSIIMDGDFGGAHLDFILNIPLLV